MKHTFYAVKPKGHGFLLKEGGRGLGRPPRLDEIILFPSLAEAKRSVAWRRKVSPIWRHALRSVKYYPVYARMEEPK